MELSEKELQLLSDIILNRIIDVLKMTPMSQYAKTMLEKDVEKLKIINTKICSEIYRIKFNQNILEDFIKEGKPRKD